MFLDILSMVDLSCSSLFANSPSSSAFVPALLTPHRVRRKHFSSLIVILSCLCLAEKYTLSILTPAPSYFSASVPPSGFRFGASQLPYPISPLSPAN